MPGFAGDKLSAKKEWPLVIAREISDRWLQESSDRRNGSLFRLVRPEAILCLPLRIRAKERFNVQLNSQ